MHLVVRADGGPEIGYGHLVRTGALASELLDRDHNVTYATTTPKHVRAVCPDGVDTALLQTRDDPEPLCKIVRGEADLVVVDSYLADGEYQEQLRDISPLIVITDDTRHKIAADVLVNGNLYAPELEYDVTGAEPEWCLGPEFLLLRSAITEYTVMEPPWRETPTRAIVTMGGSDIVELTPTVIRAFCSFDLQVDAVVGPGFSIEQEKAINRVSDEMSGDVRVARDPDDLPERMFRADFAVTTASTTTYELLALGTPIVSIPVIKNQELLAKYLRDQDIATVLDRNAGKEAFRRAIHRYMMDEILRKKRRDLGRDLVDGQGVTRVTNMILSIVGK